MFFFLSFLGSCFVFIASPLPLPLWVNLATANAFEEKFRKGHGPALDTRSPSILRPGGPFFGVSVRLGLGWGGFAGPRPTLELHA